jgi:arylsulfatase A-like enzyme
MHHRRAAASHGRHRIVVALMIGVASMLVWACGDGAPPDSDAPATGSIRPRPNVVVLVMDTTRADRCSVHGYPRPTTPSLEALGREGVVFDQAWAPSSWTLPTHASIFTGLLPQRHGATTNGASALTREHTTLAEHLRDAGYATGAFSNNPFVAEEFGLTQGFSTFVPMHQERQLPYPTAIPTHEQALAWIRRQRESGRPFFLLMNDMEPHAPYAPPAADTDAFVRDPVDADEMAWGRAFEFPANLLAMLGVDPITDRQLRLVSDLYDAEIATLDREIGLFVEQLRDDGVLDDTVFVVTGDHGEHFGENGNLAHCLSLGRPLLHVPLVIRYPGAFEGGQRVKRVVRSEDLFPTLLELCDIDVPPGIDGVSLLQTAPGRMAIGYLGRPSGIIGAAERVAAHVDMSRFDVTLHSIFDGRHQLIVSQPGARTMLFDLDSDPDARVDCSAEHPDLVSRLLGALPGAPLPTGSRPGDAAERR